MVAEVISLKPRRASQTFFGTKNTSCILNIEP